MEDGSIQGHMAPIVSKLKIKNECIRVVLAETLCTFIMMVFGLGSVAQVVTGNGVFGEYFSINVGFGLGVAMGLHIGGIVSGAHINAAVSFTMGVFGRLHWKMFPLYVFAQFLGSFLAAGTIFFHFIMMLYIITVGAISLCRAPKQQLGSSLHIQHLTSQSTPDSSIRFWALPCCCYV